MKVHFYLLLFLTGSIHAADPTDAPARRAFIDGTEPGFRELTAKDFTKVNSHDDTWKWGNGLLHCTGKPTSVMRTVKEITNFEMVVEWRHLKEGGNSGIFVWTTPESIQRLTQRFADTGKGGLPDGIEVQVLDHGYTAQYEARFKKPADWFTTHGDVFPVRAAKMTPFPPVAPNGTRSFPSKNLSKGVNEWNHYYVRAINGEVRLWVNGGEVSGGTDITPATGYLCLESEGSPIEFRKLRLRELP